MTSSDELWYALSVHARQERAAADGLQQRGFYVFLPQKLERRAWSDRVQTVETALFPGYLFLRTLLNARNRVEMIKVRQVNDLVGRLGSDDRIARPIPSEQIENIQILLAAEREVDPVDKLVTGTVLRVVRGPLAGLFGVVERGTNGKRRLVAQIELLGRGVRTELSVDDVLAEP